MKKQKVKKESKSAFQKAVVGVVKESKSLNIKGKKFIKKTQKNWKESELARKELKKLQYFMRTTVSRRKLQPI